jgi:hypothetical protein
MWFTICNVTTTAVLNEIVTVFVDRSDEFRSMETHVLERFVPALAAILQDEFGTPILPTGDERIAVAFECPKTAALLFDRVLNFEVLDPTAEYPSEVIAYGATKAEIVMLALHRLFSGTPETHAARLVMDLLGTSFAPTLQDDRPFARAIAEGLARERHVNAVPILGSRESCDAQYRPGRYDILVAVLQDIQVVNEADLSWSQVLEFRRDKKAREQYRRFIHWVDERMVGRTKQFIADEFAGRLADYEFALRKHGISTVLGAVETMLDPKFVFTASAVVGGAAFAAGGIAAAIAGGAVLAAKGSVSVARALLDLEDIRRNSPEVAMLHSLKRVGDVTCR